MGVAEGMWKEIYAGKRPDAARVRSLVEDHAPVYSREEERALGERLDADVLGAGPLRDVLALPGVTDVLVNGTAGVWIDRGDGVERVALDLGGPEDLRRLAVRLAALAGRRLDDAAPYVDAVLPGGVRLHALLPPLVDTAAHLSLRLPGTIRPGLDDLVARGAMPAEVARMLVALVRTRTSFVISGGTGSGKTTLLAALLRHVPHDERLLVVEDVRELVIDHPHVVRLEARAANVEGVGEVPLTTLLRQSLRMRPDRIVVGEVRGAEVRELMTALNTGHEGGCGTVHANAAADVPARFEALGALAGMSPEAVRTQMRPAISMVVHVERAAGVRRVASLGVLDGDHHGLGVVPAWTTDGPGPAWNRLAEAVGGSENRDVERFDALASARAPRWAPSAVPA